MAVNCITHGNHVNGISFICPRCRAVYCLQALQEILLETKRCVSCATKIENMEEFKFFVSKSLFSGKLSSANIKIGSTKNGHVKKTDKNINGSIKNQIVYNMRSVPREKRAKFLEIYLEKLHASLF